MTNVKREAKKMIKETEFPEVTFDDTLVNVDKCPVAKRVLSTKVIQKRDIAWEDVVDVETEEDTKFYDTLQVILVIMICVFVAIIFAAMYLTLKLVGVIA